MPAELRIQSALHKASETLSGYVDNPVLEAELLLAHCLDQPRSHLRAWPERILVDKEQAEFWTLIERRLAGEPVAYLTGKREFWSLPIHVRPGVLIPRAETEVLVECALAYLPKSQEARVVDLGTGSGAIAIALAYERPLAHIVATDSSPAALAIAHENAQQLECKHIEFLAGDWLDALQEFNYDLIVSNPPYIAENDPHLLAGDLPAEPIQALSSGPDGLDAIRHIIANARPCLRPGGWLMLEHGYDQGAAVRTLLNAHGYSKTETTCDLEGRERVTAACRPADDLPALRV